VRLLSAPAGRARTGHRRAPRDGRGSRARRLPDRYPQWQVLQLGGVDDLGGGPLRRDRLRARVAGADVLRELQTWGETYGL
jgi:hypothetical protein